VNSKPIENPLLLPPGYRLVTYDIVSSTMDEAKILAAAGAQEGTLIWAKAQSAGRGRQGRVWKSEPGNLYLSLILRPHCSLSKAPEIGFVASLALHDAIKEFLPESSLTLKWPNDLLVKNRKMAGIILEAMPSVSGQVDSLILGVGVNISHYPSDDQVRLPATCLVKEQGKSIDTLKVMERFVHALHKYLNDWRSKGFAPILQTWRKRTYPYGTKVSVGQSSGKFLGLSEKGELLLELEDGKRQSLTAGDAYFYAAPGEA